MTNMMFSSAEYIRELRTSGLSQEQSETISRGVENIRDDMNQLATKEGLQEVKDDLREIKKDLREVKGDVNGLGTELRHEVTELRGEIRDLRNDIKKDFIDFRTEIKEDFKMFVHLLDNKILDIENKVLNRWIAKSSMLIITAVATIIALITFMHR